MKEWTTSEQRVASHSHKRMVRNAMRLGGSLPTMHVAALRWICALAIVATSAQSGTPRDDAPAALDAMGGVPTVPTAPPVPAPTPPRRNLAYRGGGMRRSPPRRPPPRRPPPPPPRRSPTRPPAKKSPPPPPRHSPPSAPLPPRRGANTYRAPASGQTYSQQPYRSPSYYQQRGGSSGSNTGTYLFAGAAGGYLVGRRFRRSVSSGCTASLVNDMRRAQAACAPGPSWCAAWQCDAACKRSSNASEAPGCPLICRVECTRTAFAPQCSGTCNAVFPGWWDRMNRARCFPFSSSVRNEFDDLFCKCKPQRCSGSGGGGVSGMAGAVALILVIVLIVVGSKRLCDRS